jgi:imidazolonepropionase-like amidohydrolase
VTSILGARPHLAALSAAWLFDGMAAGLTRDPVVILDGAKIVAVRHGVAAPPDAEVVDLGDAVLMPGLVDTHVHLAFDASGNAVEALAARTDDEVLTAMRQAARLALTGGVTTVRDLGDRGYLSLRLRDEPGLPTVVAAGPPITSEGGHCHFLGGVAAQGMEGVRAAVREHAERGVGVVKIMASGGTMTPGTRQEVSQFSAQELRAAVEESHRLGLPITAHAHGRQAIVDAVTAGVDGIEHATFWTEDGVDDPGDVAELIATRRVAVGATLGVVPVAGVAPPPEIAKRMPAVMANGRRLREAGALLTAGTDAGIAPVKPHDVLRYALPQLVDLGMSTVDALRAVTSVAADVVGLAVCKGRIAAGYDADILAVGGNPLTDLDAIHRLRAVYSGGVRVV